MKLFYFCLGIIIAGGILFWTIANAAVPVTQVVNGGTGRNTFTVSQLLYGNLTGGLSSVATSTLSASSPLTGSFTVVGTTGSVGCQIASGSQAGCLASADWTTFNNKVSNINAGTGIATSSSSGATTVTSIGTTTNTLWADVNRTDSYSALGTIERPYKSISSMIAGAPVGASGLAINLSPGTYVDGAPDTFPNIPIYLSGNEATYVAASGVTIPNSFDIYDLTISGNVVQGDNSLTNIHQFNNGVVSGNYSFTGLATIVGSTITGGSYVYGLPRSLANINGSNIQNPVGAAGDVNINGSQVQVTSNTGYAIAATSTYSNINLNGVTVIAVGTGGGVNVNDGATSTPNFLSNFNILTGGSSLDAGNAATLACDFSVSSLTGTFIWPTGSNYIPCYDEKLNVLNNLGVGTTSPTASLGINGLSAQANALFTVASSSATATSTVFNIDKNGNTQLLSGASLSVAAGGTLTLSALTGTQCLHEISGLISGTGSDCGSGGGGGSFDPFTHTTNFGVNASATTTALWAQAGLFASSSSAFPTLAVSQTSTGPAATFDGGVVGIGSTTPWGLLSVGAPAQTNAYFAIGSTSGRVLDVSPSGSPHLNVGTTSSAHTVDVTGNMFLESSSANAFGVGAFSTTSLGFQVDQSAGIGNGVAIQAQTPGTNPIIQGISVNANEGLTLEPKGTGTLLLQTQGIGSIQLQDNGGSNSGRITINQNNYIITSGPLATASTVRFNYTGGVDTSLTTTAEAPEVYWNLGQIRQHTTGAIATQRDFRITGSTHTFLTGTNANNTIASSTVFSIDGPAAQGALENITNAIGEYIGPGSAAFTSASTTNAYGLVINGPTGATNSYAASTTGRIIASGLTSSGSSQTGYICYNASGELIQDTTTCLVSALKFKTNIKDLTLGLDTVMSMRPVTYFEKNPLGPDTTGQQVGFIADWSAKAVPQLITHDNTGAIHGFNYEQYTAVLTKAIQDQQKEIEALGGGKAVRSLEENGQDGAIGMLLLYVFYNEYTKRKRK